MDAGLLVVSSPNSTSSTFGPSLLSSCTVGSIKYGVRAVRERGKKKEGELSEGRKKPVVKKKKRKAFRRTEETSTGQQRLVGAGTGNASVGDL